MKSIEQIFQDLTDLPCWNVKWDIDLGLSMNFGQPVLKIYEPVPNSRRFAHYRQVNIEGEWLLWIMSGLWELSGYDFDPVRYASTPYKRKLRALLALDGQKIVKTAIDPVTGATQWEFDLGAKLSVRRRKKSERNDIWSLNCPHGYTATVRADGKYYYGRLGEDLDESAWKPIA